MGAVPAVRVPSDSVRGWRRTIEFRQRLLSQRVRVKNRRRMQSGQMDRQLGISDAGSRLLRKMLVQSAWMGQQTRLRLTNFTPTPITQLKPSTTIRNSPQS